MSNNKIKIFTQILDHEFSEAELKRFREMKEVMEDYKDALISGAGPEAPDFDYEEYNRFCEWDQLVRIRRYYKKIRKTPETAK